PGYSHLTDFISELAARRSPTESLMRDAGFIATGVLYIAFAAGLTWRFRTDRLAWVASLVLALGGAARIGAGIFACEPGCAENAISLSQDWHYRYAAAGYWLMMWAAVMWGLVGNRYSPLRRLLAIGIGVAIWSAVSLALMDFYPEWQGLLQRFASGILSVWVLVLAVMVWRVGESPMTLAPSSAPAEPDASSRLSRR
ncbi:MAG: DUF998 domain-containing protein, partial [Gammaproteobacteria bacterium]